MSIGVEFPKVVVSPEKCDCVLQINVPTELYLKLYEENPALCESLKRRLSVAAEAIIRSYLD